MRILVCGGRDFKDRNLMVEALKDYEHQSNITIIHGAASGADSMAHSWATAFKHNIESYPADWDKYGKAAGPIRNAQMLKEGKPDLVLAFRYPDSRGTQNMVDKTEKAGIRSIVVDMEIANA